VPRIDHDRALGALLGLAVGDALGAPLEGTAAGELNGTHTELTGGGPHAVRPGQGTGDTQMALRLGISLADLGGYDAGRALAAYVAWYRTEPPGMSGHMREVLGKVAGGDDSQRATTDVHFGGGSTSGNGALMRTTPIGVAFAGHDEALRDATLADAAITHFDPLAGKVALLHNQVVAWMLTSDAQRVFDELKDGSWLDDRIEDVVVPATSGTHTYAESLARSEPGSAIASIAVALAAFFNADDFEQGLVWAVNLGGDADTNGAVTGALLGARLGASAIPARWLDPLERRAEIEALAPRLAALAG
jgi:ADP-ribosyl-[dinitrogen reductase] hydrolase